MPAFYNLDWITITSSIVLICWSNTLLCLDSPISKCTDLTWWVSQWGMEHGEVDQGIWCQEKVGDNGCNSVQLSCKKKSTSQLRKVKNFTCDFMSSQKNKTKNKTKPFWINTQTLRMKTVNRSAAADSSMWSCSVPLL